MTQKPTLKSTQHALTDAQERERLTRLQIAMIEASVRIIELSKLGGIIALAEDARLFLGEIYYLVTPIKIEQRAQEHIEEVERVKANYPFKGSHKTGEPAQPTGRPLIDVLTEREEDE